MISGCRFGKLTAKPELNCGALDLRRSFLWLCCWKESPLDFVFQKKSNWYYIRYLFGKA
jgi:hypothetical protein